MGQTVGRVRNEWWEGGGTDAEFAGKGWSEGEVKRVREVLERERERGKVGEIGGGRDKAWEGFVTRGGREAGWRLDLQGRDGARER